MFLEHDCRVIPPGARTARRQSPPRFRHVVHGRARARQQGGQRRRGIRAERGDRPARASAAPGAGDHRPGEGSVLHAQPRRVVRVQAVFDRARQRGELPGAHAGQTTPAESREKSHEGREGQPERPGCESLHLETREDPTEKNREDWAARVSRDETVLPSERTAEPFVPGGLPGDRRRVKTAPPVHERVRTESRAVGQGVPVLARRRRTVRDCGV